MPHHAIHLGTAWEPPTAATRAWVRRFGRPSGVEKADRLVLVCEAADSPGVWRNATLNDHALAWRHAGPGAMECDVTGMIADRNLLVVAEVAPDVAPGVTSGPNSETRVPLPPAWGRLSLVVVSD
jgi:hypothetical protein